MSDLGLDRYRYDIKCAINQSRFFTHLQGQYLVQALRGTPSTLPPSLQTQYQFPSGMNRSSSYVQSDSALHLERKKAWLLAIGYWLLVWNNGYWCGITVLKKTYSIVVLSDSEGLYSHPRSFLYTPLSNWNEKYTLRTQNGTFPLSRTRTSICHAFAICHLPYLSIPYHALDTYLQSHSAKAPLHDIGSMSLNATLVVFDSSFFLSFLLKFFDRSIWTCMYGMDTYS